MKLSPTFELLTRRKAKHRFSISLSSSIDYPPAKTGNEEEYEPIHKALGSYIIALLERKPR